VRGPKHNKITNIKTVTSITQHCINQTETEKNVCNIYLSPINSLHHPAPKMDPITKQFYKTITNIKTATRMTQHCTQRKETGKDVYKAIDTNKLISNRFISNRFETGL
jgi:hypothetical protein